MTQKKILITGAAGEIGQALVKRLSQNADNQLITFDLNELPQELEKSTIHYQGSIVDHSLLEKITAEHEFDEIYHLAALLSTSAEISPRKAHLVNVGGTSALIEHLAQQCQTQRKKAKFIFPSSIAVYGMPNLETKDKHPTVQENEWNYPVTMYGVNKLYNELMGVYYSSRYKQLSEENPILIDFRSVRFPGLISAFTVPSGGTTDYGPEMLHAAAQGKPYKCFVRPDSRLPFMAMPDAIDALLILAEAPEQNLKRRVYNVTSFSLSAADFQEQTLKAFPNAEITFEVQPERQAIVDSWPQGVDDSDARKDWDWNPKYGLESIFSDYLIPNIKELYLEKS